MPQATLEWTDNYLREIEIGKEVENIVKSQGFRNRVGYVEGLLKSLYVPQEEMTTFIEGLKRLPRRLLFDCAIRSMQYEFEQKYGVSYTLVDPRQIMLEVCDLEYGRANTEKLTPIQKEYIALWAEKLEEEMRSIKERNRQFPSGAYTPPATEQPKPAEQPKERPTENNWEAFRKELDEILNL